MKTKQNHLEVAARVLARRSRLYKLIPEASEGSHIVCVTSSSMPFVFISKNQLQVFIDLRYFALLRHTLIGVYLFDKTFELPTSRMIGQLHLESALWTMLAERSLDPGHEDIALSLGVLTQESVFYHHSLPTMGAFAPDLPIPSFSLDWSLKFFRAFAIAHELAHVNLKMGEVMDEDSQRNLIVSLKLLDEWLARLEAKENPIPELVEALRASKAIRASKNLFEEVLADIASISSLIHAFNQMAPGKSQSLALWLSAQSVLYGLAASRLLGYTTAFAAKSQDEFSAAWSANQLLFSARQQIAEAFISVQILQAPEDSSPPPDEQIARLRSLVVKLFNVVRQAEQRFRWLYSTGRVLELRASGSRALKRKRLNAQDALIHCAGLLGWE